MKTIAVFVICMSAAAMPAVAHHSFAAEYDSKKPVTMTGAVTKVEWLNPHARIYIDVKDSAGNVTNWEFELAAPNGLIRAGWTRNSIKPGDVVKVEGYRAKDGSNLGNAATITMPDGRKLAVGSPIDENTNK